MTAEFSSWRSYALFCREVARDFRYVRSPNGQRFLDTLAATSQTRSLSIPKGRRFYRAQVAHADIFEDQIDDFVPGPALPDRMRPLVDRASEGRVNAKGIPCLYMGSDEHTAIAEVRPWIGSHVSVGIFETVRDLRIVNCSKASDLVHIYDGEPSAPLREESIWEHIARSFREPVTRNDDMAEYAPTQIIAEVFQANGFDGNGGGGKSDIPPADWFSDKDDSYLDKHLIPKDKDLWQLDRFEDFIAARKALLVDHFRKLKVLPPAAA